MIHCRSQMELSHIALQQLIYFRSKEKNCYTPWFMFLTYEKLIFYLGGRGRLWFLSKLVLFRGRTPKINSKFCCLSLPKDKQQPSPPTTPLFSLLFPVPAKHRSSLGRNTDRSQNLKALRSFELLLWSLDFLIKQHSTVSASGFSLSSTKQFLAAEGRPASLKEVPLHRSQARTSTALDAKPGLRSSQYRVRNSEIHALVYRRDEGAANGTGLRSGTPAGAPRPYPALCAATNAPGSVETPQTTTATASNWATSRSTRKRALRSAPPAGRSRGTSQQRGEAAAPGPGRGTAQRQGRAGARARRRAPGPARTGRHPAPLPRPFPAALPLPPAPGLTCSEPRVAARRRASVTAARGRGGDRSRDTARGRRMAGAGRDGGAPCRLRGAAPLARPRPLGSSRFQEVQGGFEGFCLRLWLLLWFWFFALSFCTVGGCAVFRSPLPLQEMNQD